jgi:hypothetical protein
MNSSRAQSIFVQKEFSARLWRFAGLLGATKGKQNRKKQTNHLVIGNGPCAPRIRRRYLFCFQPSLWSVCGQLSYGPILVIVVVHDLIFFCHRKAPVFPAFVGAISNGNNSLTFPPFLFMQGVGS